MNGIVDNAFNEKIAEAVKKAIHRNIEANRETVDKAYNKFISEHKEILEEE